MAELQAAAQGLTARAATLGPDASALQGQLAQHSAGLDALAARLDGLQARLDATIKTGTPGDVNQVLIDLRAQLSGLLAAAVEKGKALEAELGRLEAAAPAAPPAAAPRFEKALSTGFSLSGNLTGIEAQLVAFIEDSARPVDKATWFDFDRLVFDSGSASLDMNQSEEQLANVAEILKAYPTVSVKVGGYTDNEGNPATNLTLSRQRAENVARAIVARGVKAPRLDPEGYGAEHPVCPANDTEECRAQNRRISLRVTAK